MLFMLVSAVSSLAEAGWVFVRRAIHFNVRRSDSCSFLSAVFVGAAAKSAILFSRAACSSNKVVCRMINIKFYLDTAFCLTSLSLRAL